MPRGTKKFKCKICAQKKTATTSYRYDKTKHKELGLKNVQSTIVCTTCHKMILTGKIIVLYTQLPIPRINYRPHKGLYATTKHKLNAIINIYNGKIRHNRDIKNSDYVWKWSNKQTLDATNTICKAKYSNHYVTGLFPLNAKLYNMKC
jgi:hypothetical protein